MRRAAAAWLLVAACGPVAPPAVPAASDALASHDARRIRALFHDSVRDQGIWFADPACEAAFPTLMTVSGAKLDAFAACLAKLDLRPSGRDENADDLATYTYEPGLEVEANVLAGRSGPWVVSIGYVGRRDVADGLPTVTPDALEQLRVAGDRAAPADRTRALGGGDPPYAWLKLCIDADGHVVRTDERVASSPAAARTYIDLAKTWQFRPFVVRGHAIPVCAMELFHEPTDPRAVFALPPPTLDKPDVIVLSRLGERHGATQIQPSAEDYRALDKAGLTKAIGDFQYCIDTTGAVDDVRVLRSTGMSDYDDKLVAGIRKWTYAPYLDEGKPIPACAVVTYHLEK